MKSLIILASLMFGSISLAYTERECAKNDVVVVNVSVSKDRFEPRIIYLQEGDKVCLYVTAIDYAVAFSIDRLPVAVNTRGGKTSFTYFTVPRAGEYAIKCRGGCALGVDAKVIVQTKAEFQKFQEKDYREKSEGYRKKVGDDQRQMKYEDEQSEYYRKNPSEDSSRYRRKAGYR